MLSGNDRQAILELSNRYYHDLDSSRWSEAASHFTNDAHFESQIPSWTHYQDINPTLSLSLIGCEQIRDLLPLVTAEASSDHRILGFDGRFVTTTSAVRYQHPGDAAGVPLTGRWLDRFEKLDGVWRITHHLVVIDWDSHPGSGISQAVVSGIALPASPSIDPDAGKEGSSLTPEDLDDIVELLYAYGLAIDHGRSQDALDLFSPDARFEAPVRWWAVYASRLPNNTVRLVGKPHILQFFANSGGGKAPEPGEVVKEGDVRVLHEATTCSIEGDEYGALLTRYFGFFWLDDPPTLTLAGHYKIQVRPDHGAWKFSHVHCHFDWSQREEL